MASLIPGYEYDIFISYRQKDNKHDGWVTEFVNQLKGEIESAFKEDVSIYFDENPHDGLLETHDVDASLENKLKCLVFIPIISRTYCDPKSFAWEHEFKAFVEQASKDQLGLKVKLPNGNVANRVLPVRIHDLDNDDIKLCESLLGGYLRGVEFIYKEPGVNKPLTSEDDDKKNLNSTKYRIQINKVANAIKEIISGLKAEKVGLAKEKTEPVMPWEEVKKEKRLIRQSKPGNINKRKLFSRILSISLLLILAGIIFYPKFFKSDSLKNLRASDGRIPLAIMPFQNMSNDSSLNYLKDWIPESVTSYLSNFSEDLQVRQTESVFSTIKSQGLTINASITPSVATVISQKLDVTIFISGSLTKTPTGILINAKLVNSRTEEVLRAFEKAGNSNEILSVIDTLARKIKDYLIVSKLKKELNPDIQRYVSTTSPEALRHYILGQEANSSLDFRRAPGEFLKAVRIDSNFIEAYIRLMSAYSNVGKDDSAKILCLWLFNKKDQMPSLLRLQVESAYTWNIKAQNESNKYLRQLLELDDQQPIIYYKLGFRYSIMNQPEKAIPELEKALEIYKKWGIKPHWVLNYRLLGGAYHATKQYKKEENLYNKAEKDFPDDFYLLLNHTVLLLSKKDTIEANRYIDKLISISIGNNATEAERYSGLAMIYHQVGLLNKAEEYYRKALIITPEEPLLLNNLASILIENDRNIDEGLVLVDKALKQYPDNWAFLDTKALGLYKKGKYEEALKLFQRCSDLYPYYNQPFMQEAKKAIANQKKN